MTLTNFIVFWLCSIAFTAVGRVVLTFSVLKDAATIGYKLNLKNKDNLNNQQNHFEMFVPGYNIMHVLYLLMTSKNYADLLLSHGIALGMFEEMTNEEKDAFKKNPGGLSALIIGIKSRIEEIEKENIKEENKKITVEEKETIEKELNILVKKLNSIKPNETCNIKIGDLIINFTLIEQNNEKKIIFNNYSGDLSKISDDDLNELLLLGILDTKSTADYYIELRNKREVLQSKNTLRKKYIELQSEVLQAEKEYENRTLIDGNEFSKTSDLYFGSEKKKTKKLEREF